jgi:hypothetical protein
MVLFQNCVLWSLTKMAAQLNLFLDRTLWEIHIKPSCLKPVAQLEPNFDGIVIGWSSSKIVSGSHALQPRWPPQCSSVVIESNFDPGERLQAPVSLWFLIEANMCKCFNVCLYMCCCQKSSYH